MLINKNERWQAIGRHFLYLLAAGGVGLTGLMAEATEAKKAEEAANEQFVPLLVYRTGPYAQSGIPIFNAFIDYFTMINERDGGIGGVTLTWEECETGYNTDRGVECYEQLKDKGPTGASVVSPYSTGITYALIERATADKIPILSMGYGRTDASDGRVFPYVFTLPNTYWSQASALVSYISEREGGFERLRGKKIALVYHDSAYGKEPIPILEKLSEAYGYAFYKFPVEHPGREQAQTWTQISQEVKPDWILMWGWGVMNPTAIQEAANINFPMDRFIGVWWSSSEGDVQPVGTDAIGYKGGAFHAAGDWFPVYRDLNSFVYDRGLGAGERHRLGEVLYNRGLINAALIVEAMHTAQAEFGQRPLTGEEVRWGLENLDITTARLREIGLTGLIPPIKVSCADHEGQHPVRIQQWDGKNWSFVSNWIEPMRDVVRPMIERSAAAYALEKGIAPRICA
ncbi:MAG: ABC transporter substrate-binding protein [Kiloniellales bacterium]|nr:ABC transporter substrate-binding protein [Kiloniellales bacterium]